MTRNHFKKTRVNQLKIKSITTLSNQRQRVMKDTYPYLSYKLRCYTRISGPEKSRNKNTRKNRKYISRVSDITNQLLTRPRLSRHSVELMNESLYHSQSLVFCRNFLELSLPKHVKLCVAFRQWRWTFSWRRRKTKVLKEKPKITYSVALLMAYLVAGESVQYLFIILNVI